jgi:hypothetical protein
LYIFAFCKKGAALRKTCHMDLLSFFSSCGPCFFQFFTRTYLNPLDCMILSTTCTFLRSRLFKHYNARKRLRLVAKYATYELFFHHCKIVPHKDLYVIASGGNVKNIYAALGGHSPNLVERNILIDAACHFDLPNVLKMIMMENFSDYVPHLVRKQAWKCGAVKCIATHMKGFSYYSITKALGSGKKELVDHCMSVCYELWSDRVSEAAQAGHLHILRYLHELGLIDEKYISWCDCKTIECLDFYVLVLKVPCTCKYIVRNGGCIGHRYGGIRNRSGTYFCKWMRRAHFHKFGYYPRGSGWI